MISDNRGGTISSFDHQPLMPTAGKAIYVTKPYLPNIERYIEYVRQIYASNNVTNNGELVKQLETKLAAHLGVEYLLLVTNGMIALQIALRVLCLEGQVITTPFSFVATVNALLWQNIQPVFADIDSETLNIDPDEIEKAITNTTTGVLPVHTFGIACDVPKIDRIAAAHDLRVVYDAAHAFNASFEGRSLLCQGDISVVSFHATKVFHTIEGGALIFKDEARYHAAKSMINFGIDDRGVASSVGINAKMSEFHAAMGLCVLEELGDIVAARTEAARFYLDRLGERKEITFPRLGTQSLDSLVYFPVIFPSEEITMRTLNALNRINIWPRRYFYPALSQLPYFRGTGCASKAEDIAKRILCLPLYHDIERATQILIMDTIEEQLLSIRVRGA